MTPATATVPQGRGRLRARVTALLLGYLLAVAATAAWAVHEHRVDAAMAASGVNVDARVVDLRANVSRKPLAWAATVEFAYDGDVHTAVLPGHVSAAVQVGDTVTVRHLPGSNDIRYAGGLGEAYQPGASLLFLLTLVVLLGGFGTLVFVGTWRLEASEARPARR